MDRLRIRIRTSRERLGYSMREMASVCGVSPSFLSDLENGNRMASPRTLKAVCGKLGIDYEEAVKLLALDAGDRLKRKYLGPG